MGLKLESMIRHMTMGQALGQMKFATAALFAAVLLALAAFAAPQPAMAQDAADAAPVTTEEAAPAATEEAAEATGSYTPMAPTKDKGMPTAYEESAIKSMSFQDQYTENGAYALGMHNYLLLPIITAISLFVLALLLWVMIRYNRRSNPTPSRTTHNTLIEVIWTVVPVLILVVIAVPSITLLANQYEEPPEEAVTIKAIGYQWYWGYEYPDHGVGEIVSNMLPKDEALARGEPALLAVDNRMVVPAGVPLRIQTTAADVIHSFAVPSLWFKQDAVPGRLNQKMLTIEEPGVYYGQCSELCGARHGFMPITVEALPPAEFEAWIREQGGTIPGEAEETPAEEETAEEGEETES